MRFSGSLFTRSVAPRPRRDPSTWAKTKPRFRRKQPELTGFEPGHGEQIWVFNNYATNQIIYSHKAVMDSNRALRQLPFNGKGTKPAKLRKDYWSPMAMIQFPAGLGMVGQNVFQKLREFRRLHELSWGSELLHMSKKERGKSLNDQKANSVADMAAVLGGAGSGNKILEKEKTRRAELQEGEAAEANSKLLEATVYWADERDRYYAQAWPSNVTHELGLPLETGTTETAVQLAPEQLPQPTPAPEAAVA